MKMFDLLMERQRVCSKVYEMAKVKLETWKITGEKGHSF